MTSAIKHKQRSQKTRSGQGYAFSKFASTNARRDTKPVKLEEGMTFLQKMKAVLGFNGGDR